MEIATVSPNEKTTSKYSFFSVIGLKIEWLVRIPLFPLSHVEYPLYVTFLMQKCQKSPTRFMEKGRTKTQ